MQLKKLELHGFKSFAKKSEFIFDSQITGIVGPNGSGKSNVVEAIRFVLGEQSIKSLRGKLGSDLIFNGSKGLPKMSRAYVAITFDNRSRKFALNSNANVKNPLNFDEIVISREVFSDGTNDYKINDTTVRLKDIHELIASVNIGLSGNHIVSQGETNKYLNANPRDRKEMIEDSLGLKIYHYRVREATNKLSRASVNLRESEILRRELAPHLRFLKKQVKKTEEATRIKEELKSRYCVYIKKEEFDIEKEFSSTKKELDKLSKEKNELEKLIAKKKEQIQENGRHENEDEISRIEDDIRKNSESINQISQEIGRVEGMIQLIQENGENLNSEEKTASLEKIKKVIGNVNTIIDSLLDKKVKEQELDEKLKEIKSSLNSLIDFGQKESKQKTEKSNLDEELKTLLSKKEELFSIDDKLKYKLSKIREEKERQKEDSHGIEREIFEIERKKDSCISEIRLLETQITNLDEKKQRIREERDEANVLLGKHLVETTIQELDDQALAKINNMESERREIEKMKIRLEEIGVNSGEGDLIKEYKEALERDEFLTNEIKDLKKSIASLEDIINDLRKELDKRFLAGLQKINEQFQHFFSKIFGGGKSKIEIIKIKKQKNPEENEDVEEEFDIGIDISVSVPRKKTKDINMLSGGERTLTSIALMFAISQVEPPPFIILDETDATLDEINSRKYSQMLKDLARLSQLVLVTHNRETMSCADVLYGVVLDKDDSSQIISVKLEEAVKIAK